MSELYVRLFYGFGLSVVLWVTAFSCRAHCALGSEDKERAVLFMKDGKRLIYVFAFISVAVAPVCFHFWGDHILLLLDPWTKLVLYFTFPVVMILHILLWPFREKKKNAF